MIYLEAQDTRHYPSDTLGAHVIGFTNTDGEGLYGLEYQYDKYLKGVDGYYITARDSFGNEMPIEYGTTIEAVDGYNLQTTIDITVQSYLEEQLAATVEKHQAMNRACGIVMDVKTGAILAMATSSPFNLNDPWELDALSKAMLSISGYKEGSDEYADYQRDLLTQMWSNKPVAQSYIPGSTFKIITSSMALEEKREEVSKIKGAYEKAKAYEDTVLATMNSLRKTADEAEKLTAREYWPMPDYGELLFGIRE
jgi:stage V sporulation protein D (sporulation-specific penicillin-binding protein)